MFVFAPVKHRPIMIAERHNASSVTYIFYHYLKNNPSKKYDYCLFEGALDTKTHLNNAHTAFKLYRILIADFLKTTDSDKINHFFDADLQHEYAELTQFSDKKIDKKRYPHGFGQVRNLCVHFLISVLLKKHNTQWIAIDDKRHAIKKFVEQKILDGTAYLYKQHKNIGNVTTLKQKTLLEAAPIRSKYMSDKIYDYATKGTIITLIGNRHALDMAQYTPDLADIFGFNSHNDTDNALYYYNVNHNPIRFDALTHNTHYDDYCRPVTGYNTVKLKSNFNLNSVYLNMLEKNILK